MGGISFKLASSIGNQSGPKILLTQGGNRRNTHFHAGAQFMRTLFFWGTDIRGARGVMPAGPPVPSVETIKELKVITGAISERPVFITAIRAPTNCIIAV